MSDSLIVAALRRRISMRWTDGDHQVTLTFKNSADAQSFVREVERGEPAVQARGRVVNHSKIWQEESDG